MVVTYNLRRKKVVWIQWLWSWDKTRRELSIRRRVDWRRRERQWSWLEIISKFKSKGIIIHVQAIVVVSRKKVSETERHAQTQELRYEKGWCWCWCCCFVGFEIEERREKEWSILCMIRGMHSPCLWKLLLLSYDWVGKGWPLTVEKCTTKMGQGLWVWLD